MYTELLAFPEIITYFSFDSQKMTFADYDIGLTTHKMWKYSDKNIDVNLFCEL